MAKGIGEDPARSPATIVAQTDFPCTREELIETAEDSDAPADVINFIKCMPKARYESQEEALRDFAEAERVFASGDRSQRNNRENLGRDSPHP